MLEVAHLPDEQGPILGGVIQSRLFETVVGPEQHAVHPFGQGEGANLVFGGNQVMAESGGLYFEPTIFSGVDNQMRIGHEEIFGPVVSIIEYETVEEAIRIANDSPYGLSGYVSAETVEKAAEVLRMDPEFSTDAYLKSLPYKRPEDTEHHREGLTKAGLT